MGPHFSSVLYAGVSVVLDFPANTVETRRWMRGILDTTNAAHQSHILATPDETCLARLRERNALGDHPFAASEEQFYQMSKHVVAPLASEGFNTVLHEEPAFRA
jgi:predicted kinase